MAHLLKHCSWFPHWFLQSTYFFLIFSFYVSQVHNSHKVPIEADRIMLQVFQSSLEIQRGFHNKTSITRRPQTCLKPDSRNGGQASSESVERDLKPCRVHVVNLQSWNPGHASSQKKKSNSTGHGYGRRGKTTLRKAMQRCDFLIIEDDIHSTTGLASLYYCETWTQREWGKPTS